MNRSFALIGHPIGHTFSPPIHERLFALSGQPATYAVRDLPPESLAREMPELFSLRGFNVTIPHKLAVIPFLERLDETAARYGAVNVVDCPTRCGYNTDVIGFTRAVRALGGKLTGKTLLLGCGGAGRMMAIETAYSGGELTIAVRDSDLAPANALADEIADKTGARPTVVRLSEIEGRYALLVNATPVGMFPNTDACPVSAEVIRRCDVVFDAVYNPAKTTLVRTAEQAGIPAGGGMAMLVWQAVAAHEIWDRATYPTEAVETLIADMNRRIREQGAAR